MVVVAELVNASGCGPDAERLASSTLVNHPIHEVIINVERFQ
jgi:hypothetical protein